MTDTLTDYFASLKKRVKPAPVLVSGYLTRVVGLMFEAVGVRAPIGATCAVESAHGDIEAEVVGFEGQTSYLMPMDDAHGVVPGA